jgi:predicted ATPase
MHIKSVNLRGFKRFTELRIEDLPPTARLIVLAGPNGSGKSSLFDAFRIWYGSQGPGIPWDPAYHPKAEAATSTVTNWSNQAQIEIHEPIPTDQSQRRSMFYFRTAYRHEADFTSNQVSKVNLETVQRVSRMIDIDQTVQQNYQYLVMSIMDDVFDETQELTNRQIRERLVSDLSNAMGRLFDGIRLTGVGTRPLEAGSFYFDKGSSHNFHYKNLSGGEKAAFDLLLDMSVRARYHPQAIYCIDEPEIHHNPKIQAALLDELLRILPAEGQLWIATHSIGMLRRARDLQVDYPGGVVFLDFSASNFDSPVTLTPKPVDRPYWSSLIAVALDDFASLLAPEQIVLCEGGLSDQFDAQILGAIFAAEFPGTDFMSVGNTLEVQRADGVAAKAIATVASGTRVIRVVDRDYQSDAEVKEQQAGGVRVLSRRHLESFLWDDEILQRLCTSLKRADALPEALRLKNEAIRESVNRGNDPNDIKSASGSAYVKIRKALGLQGTGSTVKIFMRDVLAPFVTVDTSTYATLKADIFARRD